MGRNNIKITFYLDAKVVNFLLKKVPNYLYYTFKTYVFYYSVCRSYFEPFISTLPAAFVSFLIILLIYTQ